MWNGPGPANKIYAVRCEVDEVDRNQGEILGRIRWSTREHTDVRNLESSSRFSRSESIMCKSDTLEENSVQNHWRLALQPALI